MKDISQVKIIMSAIKFSSGEVDSIETILKARLEEDHFDDVVEMYSNLIHVEETKTLNYREIMEVIQSGKGLLNGSVFFVFKYGGPHIPAIGKNLSLKQLELFEGEFQVVTAFEDL